MGISDAVVGQRATVAVIQLVSTADLQDNLDRTVALVDQAAKAGAQLVVLPEVFAQFSPLAQRALGERERNSDDAPVGRCLSALAKQYGIWIVGGTVPMATSADHERVSAACIVYNAKGEACARYNKLHMFDVDVDDAQGSYRESATFLPGDANDVIVVPTPFGRLGLAVCYDIRFPELFRRLFALGVDMIAVPAAFTLKTGEAHWLPLLRARAIENQCYILGANQGGRHSPSRASSGGSVVINGWGEVLAEAGRGEAVLLAEIDLASLDHLRKSMPISQHQRYTTVPLSATPIAPRD